MGINPRKADGSVDHYRLYKLPCFLMLIPLWTYVAVEESKKLQRGEETMADVYWTKYGVDIGFRCITLEHSVSKDSNTTIKEPAINDDSELTTATITSEDKTLHGNQVSIDTIEEQ